MWCKLKYRYKLTDAFFSEKCFLPKRIVSNSTKTIGNHFFLNKIEEGYILIHILDNKELNTFFCKIYHLGLFHPKYEYFEYSYTRHNMGSKQIDLVKFKKKKSISDHLIVIWDIFFLKIAFSSIYGHLQ